MAIDNKKTICDSIKELREYDSVKDNIAIIAKLNEIQCKAEKMEDRLLKYCNAIEDLGFVRVGREYSEQ